jgi:hypothetical protein
MFLPRSVSAISGALSPVDVDGPDTTAASKIAKQRASHVVKEIMATGTISFGVMVKCGSLIFQTPT